MKKTTLEVYDCMLGNCPYCEADIHETNGRIEDLTIPDIGEEGEVECPKCKKTFEYTIEASI